MPWAAVEVPLPGRCQAVGDRGGDKEAWAGADMLEGNAAAVQAPRRVPTLGRREADRGWGLTPVQPQAESGDSGPWMLPCPPCAQRTALTDPVPSLKLALCVACALGSCVPPQGSAQPLAALRHHGPITQDVPSTVAWLCRARRLWRSVVGEADLDCSTGGCTARASVSPSVSWG